MTYQSINPNTGKLLKSFEHLTAAQLEKALAAAADCFQTWGLMGIQEFVNKKLVRTGHIAAPI